MNFNSFKSFYFFIIAFTLFIIFSLCFFIPTLSDYGYISAYFPDNNLNYLDISTSTFLWPTPGYTNITSNFGYRNAPTSGARHIPWRN